MGGHVVTVNDVLDGHVTLDIQCLDWIYINAYVPKLQTSAQVVAFFPVWGIPSPALFNEIGQRFRRQDSRACAGAAVRLLGPAGPPVRRACRFRWVDGDSGDDDGIVYVPSACGFDPQYLAAQVVRVAGRTLGMELGIAVRPLVDRRVAVGLERVPVVVTCGQV
ncbi:hypothetical protein [Kibdelosporangium aridum]|uniref:hypothetical protein n=1 Tax=Kibdelosporangium aridum TaxID=2030 RepID=UPI0005600571|nr:hypothetical protein [Kibdelosporangium aridum]